MEKTKSEAPSKGNNFFLGSESNQEKTEEWIYDKYISTNNQMEKLVTKLDENKSIINLISNFKKHGNKVSRLKIAKENALISLGVCLIIFMIIKLNGFLVAYEKKEVQI